METANDEKVKALYTIVEKDIPNTTSSYSQELKSTLDHRYAAYKKNPSTAVIEEERKERIHSLLRDVHKG